MIPEKDNLFIPFGSYTECNDLFTTKMFFPCLLTGPSGVGKTISIEQLCAVHQREYFRVNIVFQTDESDLVGGLALEQTRKYVVKMTEELYNQFVKQNPPNR